MEQQFRAVIEAIPTAIVMIDETGRIALINADTEKLFGYSREELLRQPIEILAPERYRPVLSRQQFSFPSEPLSSSTNTIRDLFGLRKDGSEFPIEISLKSITTEEGAFALASITENAERPEEDEEKLYLAAVVESSDDAIISKNLDGIIRSWNTSAERIFGYTAEEMIGTPILRLLPPDRIHEEEIILSKLRRGERVDHFETIRVRKDGQLLNISATISPIHNARGQVVGASKVARDITDRKQSEKRLREAMESLKNSNLELEQFAYVASHDLQEPLRKISSYAQLLKEEFGADMQPNANEYVDIMMNGAKRLKVLIADLLSFSRITTRGKALEPTNAHACLAAAIENLEMAVLETNAIITFDELPVVEADESQLILLFQNLIGNAIKYRGEDAPEIHVGVQECGSQLEVVVEDNGIGIDQEFYDRVFQIFQRLHNRRKYSGTGIGLAICKRIVERFGGKIWLESSPGRGSKFYFTLEPVTKPSLCHC